jgi:hypothetical protein
LEILIEAQEHETLAGICCLCKSKKKKRDGDTKKIS